MGLYVRQVEVRWFRRMLTLPCNVDDAKAKTGFTDDALELTSSKDGKDLEKDA